jgi:uncharacterized protein YjbI with pentapeptide repeats
VRINRAIISEPIDLENAQIPCEIRLDDCRFYAGVSFARATIVGGLSFSSSTLERGAQFRGMKIGGDAFFDDAVFEGPVDFTGTDIARNLQAKLTKFHFGASFAKLKVGGDADVYATSFEGKVDFTGADIGGNFQAESAKFHNNAGRKIAGDAIFDSAVFEGPVEFTGTDIAGNFQIGAKFQNKEEAASFDSVKVRGSASFDTADFEGPVDLRYADLGWLNVWGASWPKDPANFHVQGMTYKHIRAVRTKPHKLFFPRGQGHRAMTYKHILTVRENEPESRKPLLEWADKSSYTADVYSNLEEFFLRQGHRGYADEAFIAKKRREREEYFRSGQWPRWLGSWMLYLLVGYGRRPWQAGWFCLAIISLGCVLFPLKKMELQDPEDRTKPQEEQPRYNRFWYSLGLFLPVVDLKTSKVWGTKKTVSVSQELSARSNPLRLDLDSYLPRCNYRSNKVRKVSLRVESKTAESGRKVKYWEIVADKSQQSWMELGLCLSRGLRGADNLDRGRPSR